MRCDRDSFVLPPVLAAARLRTPRHLRKAAPATREVENNYVAESPVRRGRKRKKSTRPGARPGNLNALTHGASTAEMRAFLRYAHILCNSARALIRQREAVRRMLARQGRLP